MSDHLHQMSQGCHWYRTRTRWHRCSHPWSSVQWTRSGTTWHVSSLAPRL